MKKANATVAAKTEKKALIPQSINLKNGKITKLTPKPEAAITKLLITKASEKNAIMRPTSVKDKNYLYSYQLDKSLQLTEKDAKKKRSKLRRDLQLLINKLITSNIKKADYTHCPDFIKFYKANYIINDFSLKSISNSSDELKQQDLIKCLDLCKASLAKK